LQSGCSSVRDSQSVSYNVAKHLRHFTEFLRLVEVVRSLDQAKYKELISTRDYEELDWFIINALMGTH